MLRSAISRAVAKNRSMPSHMEAGVPRTVATFVVLPTVAVAAGMHYNPEFRSLVGQNVPGAVDALSKATGTDYSKGADSSDGADKSGSTLPPNYETLPDLLKRIGGDEKDGESKSANPKPADFGESRKEAQGSGSSAGDGQKSGKGGANGDAGMSEMKDTGSLFTKAKEAAANGAAEASANATSLAEKAADAAKSAESALSGFGARASEISKDASVSDESASVGEKATKSPEAATAVRGSVSASTEKSAGKAPLPNTGSVKGSVDAAKEGARDAVKATGEAASGATSKSSASSPSAAKSSSDTASGNDRSKSWWNFGSGGGSGELEPSGLNNSKEIGVKTPSAGSGASERRDVDKKEEDKFARLFGKGGFDPSSVPGKDVVDVRVYERPKYLETEPAQVSRSPDGTPGKFGRPSTGGQGTSMTEVEALKAELKSQAKWDAVRLQEAVRAQSVAEKKAAASELAAVTKKHKLELAKAKEQALAEAKTTFDGKLRDMEAQMEKRRDTEVGKLLKERETSLRLELESELLERERAAAGERQREVLALKASVDALHDDLDQSREHRKASQTASAVAASAFALKDALQGSGSFAAELKTASRTSELGALIASSIPEEVSRDGLPTVEELRDAFGPVSREGRKAALVPESEVSSLWAHLLASIVSRIKLPVDTGAEPQVEMTNEERIRLAERRVACGDLKGAVEGLEGLKGLTAEIMTDWVALANARIAADVGAQALLADAIITQQSLATMTKSSENS